MSGRDIERHFGRRQRSRHQPAHRRRRKPSGPDPSPHARHASARAVPRSLRDKRRAALFAPGSLRPQRWARDAHPKRGGPPGGGGRFGWASSPPLLCCAARPPWWMPSTATRRGLTMRRKMTGGVLTRAEHRRRLLLRCVATAVMTAATVCSAAATEVASAGSAPNICTTVGLTKAAARKVFGPTVKVTLSPNPGEDVGACLIARPGIKFPGYGVGALVELFTRNEETVENPREGHRQEATERAREGRGGRDRPGADRLPRRVLHRGRLLRRDHSEPAPGKQAGHGRRARRCSHARSTASSADSPTGYGKVSRSQLAAPGSAGVSVGRLSRAPRGCADTTLPRFVGSDRRRWHSRDLRPRRPSSGRARRVR